MYKGYSRDLKNAVASLASDLIKQNKITVEYYEGLVQAFYAEDVWERLQEIAYETGVWKKWDADLLGKLDKVEIGQTLTTINGVTGEVVEFNDNLDMLLYVNHKNDLLHLTITKLSLKLRAELLNVLKTTKNFLRNKEKY